MVVWLKPCKSRSSPGPLLKQYPGPFGPGYCLLCRHAMTWLAQDLQGKSRETLQPHHRQRLAQRPPSLDAGGLLRGARPATWPRLALSPKPRRLRVRWASKYFHHKTKPPAWPGVLSGAGFADQAAASFSFFSGRNLSLVEAGLAANQVSSLVNGLMPWRFGLAGRSEERRVGHQADSVA